MLKHSRVCELGIGEELLAEETYPNAIHLVLEGELSVWVKDRKAVGYIGKGEIVGEMSMLPS